MLTGHSSFSFAERKNWMGKKDIYTKDYMEEDEIFADAFNQFIYHGEQIIKSDSLKTVDSAAIGVPYGVNGAERPIERYRDKIKFLSAKENSTAMYLLLGLENQSEIQYAMPVKNMVYDALEYASQVERTTKIHRSMKNKDKEHLTAGEYLSGFYKEDRLIPVITLVIYFGAEKWDGPRQLHQMFDLRDEKLMSFVPDYKINLLAPAELTDEEIGRFQTDLREVMYFIKYSKDKKKLMEIIQQNPAYRNMDIKAARVVNAVTDIGIEMGKSEDKVNMCKGMQDLLEDAREEVRKELQEQLETEKKRAEKAENMCKGMQDLLEDAREEGRKEMQEQLETEKKRAESIEAELGKYRNRFGEI